MIPAKELDLQFIKRAYNYRSWVYSKTVAPLEWSNHLTAIQKAEIKPGEKVLEVAVGPGFTLTELAKLVGGQTKIYGVDLSTSMLDLTREQLAAHGFSNFDLREADCRKLPFDDHTFDVLYNGYMLDLIPVEDMSGILQEFQRVLKPGGRMILLNMSKQDKMVVTPREKLYTRLPASLALYVMGGCRPVLMKDLVEAAHFQSVQRVFLDGRFPSEIVMGTKPIT
jgi:ubiquinone/menaquinone biosynthesis C-methylase UbiE